MGTGKPRVDLWQGATGRETKRRQAAEVHYAYRHCGRAGGRAGNPAAAADQEPAEGNAAGRAQAGRAVRGRGTAPLRDRPTAVRHRAGQDGHREPFRHRRRTDRPTCARRARKNCSKNWPSSARTSSTSIRGSGGNSAWDMPCSAPCRSSGAQPFVVALGDSIIGLHAQSQVVRHDDRAVRVGAGRRGDRLRGSAAGRRWCTTASPSPAAQRCGGVFELADLIEKPERGRGAEQSGRGRALRVQPGDLRLPRKEPRPARATRSN